MKKVIIITASLLCAVGVFAQGTVVFNNIVGGQVRAPVFGPELGNPFLAKQGNRAADAPPVGGTQTYTGALLSGTGFTAELWGGPLGTAEGSLLPATPQKTFRTGTAAGFVNAAAPLASATLGNVPMGRATLQLRAWDNMGGSILLWSQVLANDSIPRGVSALFSPIAVVGEGVNPSPNLVGLESFNIHQVPEPSVIALGLLGIGALLMFRRRS